VVDTKNQIGEEMSQKTTRNLPNHRTNVFVDALSGKGGGGGRGRKEGEGREDTRGKHQKLLQKKQKQHEECGKILEIFGRGEKRCSLKWGKKKRPPGQRQGKTVKKKFNKKKGCCRLVTLRTKRGGWGQKTCAAIEARAKKKKDWGGGLMHLCAFLKKQQPHNVLTGRVSLPVLLVSAGRCYLKSSRGENGVRGRDVTLEKNSGKQLEAVTKERADKGVDISPPDNTKVPGEWCRKGGFKKEKAQGISAQWKEKQEGIEETPGPRCLENDRGGERRGEPVGAQKKGLRPKKRKSVG